MSGVLYSKEDCINALKEAADRLGESPSARQYRELDIKPRVKCISDKFGSWNKAKEKAGLDTYLSAEERLKEKPDCINLSKAEWSDLDKQKRKNMYRMAKIAEIKVESGCEKCGYNDDYRALEFHHTNEKNFEISSAKNGSLERIKREAEKCKILCANCHREVEEKSYPINFD